jgi:hypothetical protein
MGQDNRARRKFSDEFKRDAVELVRSTDRPIAHVADELGIYDSTLGNWVRKAEAEDDERERLSWIRRLLPVLLASFGRGQIELRDGVQVRSDAVRTLRSSVVAHRAVSVMLR